MKLKSLTDFSADIQFNVKRVRKNDDVVKDYTKNGNRILLMFIAFAAGAATLLWLGQLIWGGIVAVVALLLLFMRIKKGRYSADFIRGVYTKGLLTPAIVRKTEPLTILAFGTLTAHSDAPTRYGCMEFKVSALPGHKLKVGERIPCAAMYKPGATASYWGYFEVHPLCWATDDMNAVSQNAEHIPAEEWESLENLSKTLPSADINLLYTLDENFTYISSRKYFRQTEEAVINNSDLENYPKKYTEVKTLDKSVANAPMYNKLIKLSVTHSVYEYLCLRDNEGNLNYLTYMSDPTAFLKKVDDLGCSLTNGEVPLVAGKLLVTNKGIWHKTAFTPWENVEVSVNSYSGRMLNTEFNTKTLVSFYWSTDFYDIDKSHTEQEADWIRALEKERLRLFWNSVKQAFSN